MEFHKHTHTHIQAQAHTSHTSSCNCDEQQQQQPMANARRRVQAWRDLNRYSPSLFLSLSHSLPPQSQQQATALFAAPKAEQYGHKCFMPRALDRFVQLALLKANANIQRQPKENRLTDRTTTTATTTSCRLLQQQMKTTASFCNATRSRGAQRYAFIRRDIQSSIISDSLPNCNLIEAHIRHCPGLHLSRSLRISFSPCPSGLPR